LDTEYSTEKTVSKALPPAIMAVAVECLDAVLQSQGVNVGKDHLYQIGAAVCCTYLAFVNWIKNRKRKK
jgi:hypothetical protein